MKHALKTLNGRKSEIRDAMGAYKTEINCHQRNLELYQGLYDKLVDELSEVEKAIRLLEAVEDTDRTDSPSLYKEVHDSAGKDVPSEGNEKLGFYPMDRMNMAGGSGSTPNMVHAEVHVGTVRHGGAGVGPFHEAPAGGGIVAPCGGVPGGRSSEE